MKKWLLSLAFLLPCLAQSEAEFRLIYDNYNRMLRNKYFDPLIAILTDEQIKMYAEVPPKQRPMFFGMTNLIPDSYEVEYLRVAKDGQTAIMVIAATLPKTTEVIPSRVEETLQFVRQHDTWRMARPVYGADPDKRPKPSDLKMGDRAEYQSSVETRVGVVLRLLKQDDGTIYVIRKDNEENAVFVPKSETAEIFVPGQAVAFQAAQNKSDKLKFWATESKALD